MTTNRQKSRAFGGRLVSLQNSCARRVAHRVVFMNQGRVWEQGPAKEFFAAPKTDELKGFLSSVLH